MCRTADLYSVGSNRNILDLIEHVPGNEINQLYGKNNKVTALKQIGVIECGERAVINFY